MAFVPVVRGGYAAPLGGDVLAVVAPPVKYGQAAAARATAETRRLRSADDASSALLRRPMLNAGSVRNTSFRVFLHLGECGGTASGLLISTPKARGRTRDFKHGGQAGR